MLQLKNGKFTIGKLMSSPVIYFYTSFTVQQYGKINNVHENLNLTMIINNNKIVKWSYTITQPILDYNTFNRSRGSRFDNSQVLSIEFISGFKKNNKFLFRTGGLLSYIYICSTYRYHKPKSVRRHLIFQEEHPMLSYIYILYTKIYFMHCENYSFS